MYNQQRNVLFAIIGLVVVVLVYNSTIGKNYDKKLIANHLVVCGNIIGMRSGKGVNVIYEFFYNGKKYSFNESSPKATLEDYKNGKTTLLVVFQKDDPDNNRILSKYEDFIEYNIKSEDTLGVVCK